MMLSNWSAAGLAAWLVGCSAGSAPSVTAEPTHPATLAETQIGNDGGTETGTEPCDASLLGPDDVLSSGDRVGDLLARLGALTEVEPAWFDGRTAQLTALVAWNGGPIERQSDCEVYAEVDAEVVASDGAVNQMFAGSLALLGEVTLRHAIPDASWTGALTAEALHTETCLAGSAWTIELGFEVDGQRGEIVHRCVLVSSGEGDTGAMGSGGSGSSATTDTTDPHGTTLTGTTTAPFDEQIAVAVWELP